MRTSATMVVWSILFAATTLAVLGNGQQPAGAQQTITSNSTRVVVVLIPGFPVASILLGAIVGVIVVTIMRLRHRPGAPEHPA